MSGVAQLTLTDKELSRLLDWGRRTRHRDGFSLEEWRLLERLELAERGIVCEVCVVE